MTAIETTQIYSPPTSTHYDVIVIGSGMGGLVTATQLAAKGATVLVLER
jgi:prolycopene isomerase